MANSGSVFGQIGESFEQLGKDVARESVQAPKDIAGKILETAGVSGGKKKKGQQQTPAKSPVTPEEAHRQQQEMQHAEEIKRAVARRALEELSGVKKQAEPTVWERLQKEEEEKEAEKKRKEAQQKAALPQMSSKRKRGDLYGKQAKKTQVENRNVRQD